MKRPELWLAAKTLLQGEPCNYPKGPAARWVALKFLWDPTQSPAGDEQAEKTVPGWTEKQKFWGMGG